MKSKLNSNIFKNTNKNNRRIKNKMKRFRQASKFLSLIHPEFLVEILHHLIQRLMKTLMSTSKKHSKSVMLTQHWLSFLVSPLLCSGSLSFCPSSMQFRRLWKQLFRCLKMMECCIQEVISRMTGNKSLTKLTPLVRLQH